MVFFNEKILQNTIVFFNIVDKCNILHIQIYNSHHNWQFHFFLWKIVYSFWYSPGIDTMGWPPDKIILFFLPHLLHGLLNDIVSMDIMGTINCHTYFILHTLLIQDPSDCHAMGFSCGHPWLNNWLHTKYASQKNFFVALTKP